MSDTTKSHELYVPRKCSATNRIITARDHASVQLNVGHLDNNGVYTGSYTTFALSGFVRAEGGSDYALSRLASEHSLMKSLDSFPKEHKFRRED